MSRIAVIRYENISPDETVTETIFDEQINWLINNKIKIISLYDLDNYLKGKLQLKNAALIAMTDAHLDSWVWTYPILKKYRIPAVLFVDSWEIEEDEFTGFSSSDIPKIEYNQLRKFTAPIKSSYEDKAHFRRARLSWLEIKTMSDKYFLCQSAGKLSKKGFIDDKIDGFITAKSYPSNADNRLGTMHFREGSLLANKAFIPDKKINDRLCDYVIGNGYTKFFDRSDWQKELSSLLPDAPYGRFETDDEYKLRVKSRLIAAKGELQTEIKKEVYALFWPFGEYSAASIKIAESVGFRLFFTKRSGFVKIGCQNEIPSLKARTLKELKSIYV